MEPLFKIAFWSTNLFMWPFLIVLYFYLTNTRLLKNKGYNDAYIHYFKKSQLIRIITIAIVLPALELLSGWIIYKLTGELTNIRQLAYILLVLFVLVIPFKWLDERFNQKKIKQLALETKEDVVADFNFRILHLIFRPPWEIILGILCLVYFIWILKIEYWTVYFHLAIPWLLYFTAKGIRYQTRPYLKDNYNWVFAFNMVNFLLVILFLILDLSKEFTDSQWYVSIPGVILAFLLIAKLTWYVVKYPEFKETVTSGSSLGKQYILGRFTFYFAVFSILFAGIGFISEKKNTHMTEVGEVYEKYIIGVSGMKQDTLVVITSTDVLLMDSSLSMLLSPETGIDPSAVGRIENSVYQKIRYVMSLDLTVTKKRQDYTTDCLQIFNEIPFNRLVKFEYNARGEISKLLEY